METPVVLVVFNRPEPARKVFEAVRAARPPRLFVVADGPRQGRAGEAEKCAATRAVADAVDWDCEVVRDFSDANMGCKARVASGIGRAFESVDRAIILEDDCVPSPSFFRYCDEMLERYADDERVMVVSGDNQLFGAAEVEDSYYFSRYAHMWGWATWRRAWSLCDLDMRLWPEARSRGLLNQYFHKASERYYWESLLQYVYEGNIDTWDYQWVFSIWANSGLCAVPRRNLIRNIGFDADATHTKRDCAYARLGAEDLSFPLAHPKTVMARSDLDELEARLRTSHSGGLPYPLNKYASKFKRTIRTRRDA
jgi:hypothetical protein